MEKCYVYADCGMNSPIYWKNMKYKKLWMTQSKARQNKVRQDETEEVAPRQEGVPWL